MTELVFGEFNTKQMKSILVVGAKSRGKSTFINSLTNHLWDVKHDDNFRFMVAEKENATAYVLNNTKLAYNVTIVDIGSFEEDEKHHVYSKL